MIFIFSITRFLYLKFHFKFVFKISKTYNARIGHPAERVDFPEQNAKTPHVRFIGKFLLNKNLIKNIIN